MTVARGLGIGSSRWAAAARIDAAAAGHTERDTALVRRRLMEGLGATPARE